jgi:NADH:ubiquinone oxidoreductase subunit F (NADH-binding)
MTAARGSDAAALPRLLAGIDPGRRPLTLAEHERLRGPLPRIAPATLIDEVARSGLRGRGGADFPTARKLESVAARRSVSAVVVNGSETEPASRKDELLLACLPHLVLDGALVAAHAVGAGEVIVKLRAGARRPRRAMEEAIAERPEKMAIRVEIGPDGYVGGEETAVIGLLNGGAQVPRFLGPRPFERGYRDRPTLLQNAETLAHLALIARFGARWFRGLGTDEDPGTFLTTISGAVAAPGVYEVAFGTPLRDLVAAAGGPTERLQAFLVGGYFGTWIQAGRCVSMRLGRAELADADLSLGSGVLIALGERSCGLHETARLARYLARESAGQCGPCVYGLRAIADSLAALVDGAAGPEERTRILRWAEEIRGRGACHHPDGVVRMIRSSLAAFSDEIELHAGGRCHATPASLPIGAEAPRRRRTVARR